MSVYVYVCNTRLLSNVSTISNTWRELESQAKVDDLNGRTFGLIHEEDVLGLKVSVHDPEAMEKSDGFQQALDNVGGLGLFIPLLP